jgi:hypothetical protein
MRPVRGVRSSFLRQTFVSLKISHLLLVIDAWANLGSRSLISLSLCILHDPTSHDAVAALIDWRSARSVLLVFHDLVKIRGGESDIGVAAFGLALVTDMRGSF